MTALVIALALGALAGGAICVAVSLDAYEAREARSLTPYEWRRDRAIEGAAIVVAACLAAADAAAALFEVARSTAIWLAPRRGPR